MLTRWLSGAGIRGAWTSPGTVIFADSDFDFGLVSIDHVPADEAGLSWAEFGTIAEHAAVVPYESVGFPRFKLRTRVGPDGIQYRYRDAAHIRGVIPSLANSGEGTLELIVDDPPRDDPDPATFAVGRDERRTGLVQQQDCRSRHHASHKRRPGQIGCRLAQFGAEKFDAPAMASIGWLAEGVR